MKYRKRKENEKRKKTTYFQPTAQRPHDPRPLVNRPRKPPCISRVHYSPAIGSSGTTGRRQRVRRWLVLCDINPRHRLSRFIDLFSVMGCDRAWKGEGINRLIDGKIDRWKHAHMHVCVRVDWHRHMRKHVHKKKMYIIASIRNCFP